MLINKTRLIDCYEINPHVFADKRGTFIKTFHQNIFEEYGLETRFVEQYYSVSFQGVLRGLHFQIPPKDHVKLVYCLFGEILDVAVDLRIGSPTFGQFELFDISGEKKNMVYLPAGMAHGFYVKSESAIVVCNLSKVYSAEHDSGIKWDSVGIPWPDPSPIVSEKDIGLPALSDFFSPFQYTGSEHHE